VLGIAAIVGALLTTQCQEATADSPTLTERSERQGNTQKTSIHTFNT